jgi:surfeit locus 1 family protein
MFKSIPLIPSLAALLLVILTVNLGAWQLRRADEKRVLQSQRDEMAKTAPRTWLPGPTALAPVAGQSVQLRGEFLEQKTVLIDNRSRNGVAGLHVVTPLRLRNEGAADSSESYVLVLRGWIARLPGEHKQLPSVKTPSGVQVVSGLALADLGKAPYLASGAPHSLGSAWPHVDLSEYAKLSGLTIAPFVVRQFSDTPDGLMRDWPLPANEVDKHLGYAFQWFALALTVVGLWLYFALIRPPAKRREHSAVR